MILYNLFLHILIELIHFLNKYISIIISVMRKKKYLYICVIKKEDVMRKFLVLILLFLGLNASVCFAQDSYDTSSELNVLCVNMKMEEGKVYSNFFYLSNEFLTARYEASTKNIKITSKMDTNFYVEIYDSKHKLLVRKYFNEVEDSFALENLESGNYIMYLFSKGQMLVSKFSI